MPHGDIKEGGIHAWMTSVRASMANDPCRQLFEDQVQTHAFIFLDDYLENIIAGPKQVPLIDLVKTPGRKKNIPRRTRATTAGMAAKVKNITLLSLDCDNSTQDIVPINNFHKALLSAKERSTHDAFDMSKSLTNLPLASNNLAKEAHGHPSSAQVIDIPRIAVSEPALQAGVISVQNYSKPSAPEVLIPLLATERGTELSVIAEGDESPERNHVNAFPSATTVSGREQLCDNILESSQETEVPSATGEGPKIISIDHQPQSGSSPDAQHPSPVSIGTYHSIPLHSSREAQFSEVNASNHTEPLPSRVAIHSPKNYERNAFTAPLPVVPVSNPIPTPLTISVPLNYSSPRALAQKPGVTGFSMLPAPSPLRKSVRVAPETLPSSALPTPAPVSVLLGKRTSWLMKAREAKAMEGTNSLPNTFTAAASVTFPQVSTAVKRKSGEMLGVLAPASDHQRKPKAAKSTEAGITPLIPKDTEKTGEQVEVALSSLATAMPVDHFECLAMEVDEQITHLDSAEEGFIDLFKRTVEGLGTRAGKSISKSLGGTAVAALAEARAAAEATVAKRNNVNRVSSDSEALHDDSLLDQEPLGTQGHSKAQFHYVPAPPFEGGDRQLSLSDLGPDSNEPKHSMAQRLDASTQNHSCNESVSTTPPDSPPLKGTPSFVKPVGPVFNKPPPVFMPPALKQVSVASGHPQEGSLYLPLSRLAPLVAVLPGTCPQYISPLDGLSSTVQGTRTSQAHVRHPLPNTSSDPLPDIHHGGSGWVPQTQDISHIAGLQPPEAQFATGVDEDDDDDSWPLEEKLAAAEPGWRPFDFSHVDKEDTWSSLPSESQGPTGGLTAENNGEVAILFNNMDLERNEEVEQEQEAVDISDDEPSIMEISELEGGTGAAMTGRSAELIVRSASQTSMASTASSSQPQTGFFNQATKFVNSMLGEGTKAKPELKSLQLAAAAAKKQQEEAGKKIQRLKDMEARRQVATAKRAEGERARLLEEERKGKEEAEKRKRERGENTDRRTLRLTSTKKAEDDTSKKRKTAPETEKKVESKKPPSKDKKDFVPLAKLLVTPTTKLVAPKGSKAITALVSSTAYNTTQNVPAPVKSAIPEAKPFRVVPSSLKGKEKAKPQEDDMNDKLPSTMVQSQMAARAKAQMQAAKPPAPEVPSESIELPEINSEYSDSEDEDRVRTFDAPDWAQSPELHQALQMQSAVNPDEIFGAIRPLRMEEMFRTRQSRFRARTSSANWSGSDRLTIEEIREYERRMGFQQTRAS